MLDPSIAIRNGEESHKAKCPECRQDIDPAKILSYNLFKKVHMADVYKEEFPDEADDNTSESDSDSESDADDDDDVDKNGNIRDFVVPGDVDSQAETEDDSSGSYVKVKHDDADADKAGQRSKSSSKKRKSKKAKGKEPKRTLAQLKKESMRNAAAKRKYLKRLRKDFVPSSKTNKVVELLRTVRENDPTEKTIIFSQFTSFLDLLEIPISAEKWKYVRYGKSSQAMTYPK